MILCIVNELDKIWFKVCFYFQLSRRYFISQNQICRVSAESEARSNWKLNWMACSKNVRNENCCVQRNAIYYVHTILSSNLWKYFTHASYVCTTTNTFTTTNSWCAHANNANRLGERVIVTPKLVYESTEKEVHAIGKILDLRRCTACICFLSCKQQPIIFYFCLHNVAICTHLQHAARTHLQA